MKSKLHRELSRHPVYMDHHATTPVDTRVLESMLPYFTTNFGNAASIDHEYGTDAERIVESTRQQIARLLKAQHDEIVFTSGATEADNLAIIGVARSYSNKGQHIITCTTEHHAVLDTCRYLEQQGWQVTYLPVDRYGILDPDMVRRAITPKTILISVMAANNEIGTIAPLYEIGQIAHEHGVIFHTDATQAIGYIPIDTQALRIDLLSLSAHKLYGPKGIGVLFVRKRHPRIKLTPIIHGGGHERGMRSGTLNVPGIVGLGKAMELAYQGMAMESGRLGELRERLWSGLQASIPDIDLNGHPTLRLPHNLNIAIPGAKSRSLVVQLKSDIAFSTGSACTTAKVEPSHVILALGYDEQRAHCSVRFGLGRENSDADVDFVIERMSEAVTRLRHIAVAG